MVILINFPVFYFHINPFWHIKYLSVSHINFTIYHHVVQACSQFLVQEK